MVVGVTTTDPIPENFLVISITKGLSSSLSTMTLSSPTILANSFKSLFDKVEKSELLSFLCSTDFGASCFEIAAFKLFVAACTENSPRSSLVSYYG